MSTAIVPAKVAHILPLEVFSIERGGRNAVALASGRVASDIELIELDEKNRIARYELRVANESAAMLACYVYAVRGRGGEKPVTCTSIAVMPFSGVAVTFELPLPFIGNYDRITVEMHGDGIDLSADTVPPGRDYRILIRRSAFLAAAAIAILIAAFLGLIEPHIVAIAGPDAALGGSTIHVAYEARGWGRLTYGLIAPNGTIIGEGSTWKQTGTVAIAVPLVAEGRSYLARFEKQSIFGGDSRTTIIRAIATPPPRILTRVIHPAEIVALSIDQPRVSAGGRIDVHYLYHADSGTLRLLDAEDTVWSAVAASPAGYAQFKAPHVDHPQDLRVLLHVERAATSAESQVGIQIAPSTPQPQRFRPIPNAPLEIIDHPIYEGDEITLRMIRSVSDLHIAMQDSRGSELQSFNFEGDQMALHAPAHPGAGKFTLIITYVDRNGQETVVAPIDILSRQKKK